MKILRISRQTAGHYGVWSFVFFAAALMFVWQMWSETRAFSRGREVSGQPTAWWEVANLTIPAMFAVSSAYAGCRTTRAWWRRYRRMWNPEGQCRRCGYDLRATPNQCPECGKLTRRGRPTL